MSTWKNKVAAAAAARAYRARNREKVRARDRLRDRRPERVAVHDFQRGYIRPHGVIWNALVVTLEEALVDHETWLEMIDLWRMAEAVERAELSSSS